MHKWHRLSLKDFWTTGRERIFPHGSWIQSNEELIWRLEEDKQVKIQACPWHSAFVPDAGSSREIVSSRMSVGWLETLHKSGFFLSLCVSFIHQSLYLSGKLTRITTPSGIPAHPYVLLWALRTRDLRSSFMTSLLLIVMQTGTNSIPPGTQAAWDGSDYLDLILNLTKYRGLAPL